MPTTKLNLPLISGNMSADVPRDMNALAQKIDDLAGVPGGHALLDEDGKVIGMADMIARNVIVEDPKNIFAGGNVEVVLEELFTNADNAQRALAGVIGAPTVPGNTFAKMSTDVQERKNELATGLRRLKVSATGGETLKGLVDKVNAAPVGRRSRFGTVQGNRQQTISIRGLGFRPSVIFARGASNVAFSSSVVPYGPDDGFEGGSLRVTTLDDGFDIYRQGGWQEVNWMAIE